MNNDTIPHVANYFYHWRHSDIMMRHATAVAEQWDVPITALHLDFNESMVMAPGWGDHD